MTLTKPQLRALKLYTGSKYVEMNADLRGDACSDDEVITLVHNLQSAIENCRTAENLTLYRGIGEDFALILLNLGIGAEYRETAFVSTSRKVECATAFIPSAGGMLLEVRVPAGSKALDASPYSENPDEHEMILGPGTIFRIVAYDEEADVLRLEVLDHA